MRITFVGKGGAGKTTIAAFFSEYLVNQGKFVFALDADINIHFAQSLGVSPIAEKALSHLPNKRAIREYLRGTNERISEARFFVKTTPPGEGSSLLRIAPSDPLMNRYTDRLSDRLFVGYIGTYQPDEIGVSCYHGNLGIAENIISHLDTDDYHWLVTDMVAGTDAFSGSLHLLFDAIFLVVEPTPEGVGVFEQYKYLAESAGIWEHVWVLGNKIQDREDERYLQDKIGQKLIGVFRNEGGLRRIRQEGKKLGLAEFGHQEVFQTVQAAAMRSIWDRQEQLRKLHDLHRIHATEDYIIARCGDVSGQIDPDFYFPIKERVC